MIKALSFAAVFALCAPLAAQGQAAKPNDAQIAHIAYTAGVIDVAAGEQAIAKSHNKTVVSFAEEMVRDHKAVNDRALALVSKLGVKPQDNPTSQALSNGAADELKKLAALEGPAFDKAYIANEVAYHKSVNAALASTLIPSAQNGELKSLLETGLTLFTQHQMHAEHIARDLK